MYFVKNLVRIWLYLQFLGVSFHTFLPIEASTFFKLLVYGMFCRTWRYKPGTVGYWLDGFES